MPSVQECPCASDAPVSYQALQLSQPTLLNSVCPAACICGDDRLVFAETFSTYLLVIGWLYAPVMFNPNGLDSQAVGADYDQWLSWMLSSVEVSNTAAQIAYTETHSYLKKCLKPRFTIRAEQASLFLERLDSHSVCCFEALVIIGHENCHCMQWCADRQVRT